MTARSPATIKAAYALGTWWGCGHSPIAPGTVGTLGALPLHWLLLQTSPALHVGVVAVVSSLGFWAAQVISDDRGDKDPQLVVIDEVAGVLIALSMVRHAPWPILGASVLLFRAFDIIKPPPLAQAERASPAGLGIMLDDLLAGLAAGLVSLGLHYSGWLSALD